MDHLAVAGVGQGQLHRVAHAGAQHRAWHLAVEGPVGEAGAVIELAGQLDRLHAVLQRLRCPRTDGRRHPGWVGRHADGRRVRRALRHRGGGVERECRLARIGVRGGHGPRVGNRSPAHLEFSLHADLPVAGNRAVVGEGARARHLEAQCGLAGAGAELGRGDVQFGNHQVVLGAFAAFQHDLDRVARVGRERGVHLTLVVDKDHLAVDDVGVQVVALGRCRLGCRGRGSGGCRCVVHRVTCRLCLHGQGNAQEADGSGNGARAEGAFHVAFLGRMPVRRYHQCESHATGNPIKINRLKTQWCYKPCFIRVSFTIQGVHDHFRHPTPSRGRPRG